MAITTKSGNDNPGGSVQVTGGSFGRKAVEFEQGGKRGPWDYFLTGNLLRDRGWADHNPSRVAQFFGKVGYQIKQTDIDLSLTLADNTLQGTQTLPTSLASNTRQAYTYPDRTTNQLKFLTLKGSQFLRDDFRIGGNLYYRAYRSSSLSSNLISMRLTKAVLLKTVCPIQVPTPAVRYRCDREIASLASRVTI